MKLRPGITSLFNSWECSSLPKYPIAQFKQLVFAVAKSRGLTVGTITEAGITPNFHTAEVQSPQTSIFVLGHSNFPIIAFVKQLNAPQGLLFIDDPSIASEISRLYSDVEIGHANELNRLITEDDLAQLAEADRNQIRNWKPQTIGQVAFNWWD